MRVFQPIAIGNAALHYVDLVEIPFSQEQFGVINLGDYFVATPDLPEKPFGMTGDILMRYGIHCPNDQGPLRLQVQSLSSTTAHRFRVDWHKVCLDVNTLDLDALSQRLDRVHSYLTDCFTSSFTPRGLELFGPTAEN
jgi:hypothetical protein